MKKLYDEYFETFVGEVGEKTKFISKEGTELHVGDVVDIINKDGIVCGTNFIIKEYGEQFVNGIAVMCDGETGEIHGGWEVKLNKKFNDVKEEEVYDNIHVKND